MSELNLVELRNLYVDINTGYYYFNTAYEEMIGPFLTLSQANEQLNDHYYELDQNK